MQHVLRMRAFDNIRSPKFRSLVIEYGVGLGGAVAAGRRPIAVPNYMTDSKLDHAGYIDEIVAEEGLKAAMGVPVEFESRLLAILFVAKRRRAQFPRQQMTLLASLANSAAIAMNNAQMYAQLAGAMSIHENLMQVALSGVGPEPIAATLSELIRGPVLLLDGAAQVLAAAGVADSPAWQVSPGRSDIEAASEGAAAAQGAFELGEMHGQVIAVGGQAEGYLMVRPDGSDPGLARVAVQQAATVFALELARMRSAEQAEAQSRGDLLDELFRQPLTDEAALARRALRLGVDLDAPHVVGVLRLATPGPTDIQALWRRVGQLAGFGRGSAPAAAIVVRGDRLVLVIAAQSAGAAEAEARRLIRECRDARLPALVVGLGRLCRGAADYSASFVEAERAADTAAQMARLGPVVSFAGLDYHQLALGAQPSAQLVDLALAQLEPLVAHDRATHGGSLAQTLRTYLACCGNLEATARRLAVHPNTLRGRIARIEELTGKNLQAASTRLDLHLAIATVDLAGAPPPAPGGGSTAGRPPSARRAR